MSEKTDIPMAAPAIPNLLSLRGPGRGRPRGRGRGRGQRRGGDPATLGTAESGSSSQNNATIRGTDTSAAVARLSAVELGYLRDPFAKIFVKQGENPVTRRLPIINRGTYARTTAIDTIVDRFLTSTAGRRRQIVSLGAGTDTRPLRLFYSDEHHGVVYHELDFPETVDRKQHNVLTAPQFRAEVATDTPGSHDAVSIILHKLEAQSKTTPTNRLVLHGLDLRSLASADPPALFGLDPSLPTLVLSECCLCYLTVPESQAVLEYFTSRIPSLGAVIYEPIKPQDAFGQVMVTNLAAQGICMPTLEAFQDEEAQKLRMLKLGFDPVRNLTIDTIWERWVLEEEKERLNGLEMLDEIEEWNMLAGHYIVLWGWRGEGFDLPRL